MNSKQFLAKYRWAGVLIGFVVGALSGSGGVWSYLEYRNKSHTAMLEQTKLEKEYYERLQVIQNEVATDLKNYILLRDRQFARDKAVALDAKGYEVQNEYNVMLARLAASIDQYNRLEWKLSALEQRPPRWFVLPLPPVAPQNPRVQKNADGSVTLIADVPNEPLATRVSDDLQALLAQLEQQLPASMTDVRVDWVGTLSTVNQPLVAGPNVPSQLDTSFGIKFTLTGHITGRSIPFRVVYRLPPPGLSYANTDGVMELLNAGTCYAGVGCTVGWTFSDPKHLVPGPWTIEIWEGDRKLLSQTFQVSIK